jgi:four helix bundle protein
MMPYERFLAWQHCHKVVLAIYQATPKWPDERFALAQQARRAAYSAGLNIAEGSAKRGTREFRRYLDIANGSLSELAHILRIARDLEYLTGDEWENLERLRSSAGKLTWKLYASMKGDKGSS